MDTDNRGYVLLHRKITEHPFWRERRTFSKAEAWLDLVMAARHTPGQVMLGNTLIQCDRGQTLMALGTLAHRWGWNKSRVRRFMGVLLDMHMAVTEDVRKTTRLTICNYDRYNGDRHANDTRTTRERHASDTKELIELMGKNEKQLISPLPPQGDDGGKEKVLRTKKPKPGRQLQADTQALRISRVFRRKDNTPWDNAEIETWKSLGATEDEIVAIENYYVATMPKDSDYRRRDMQTLLNNWTSEVDRATRHAENSRPTWEDPPKPKNYCGGYNDPPPKPIKRGGGYGDAPWDQSQEREFGGKDPQPELTPDEKADMDNKFKGLLESLESPEGIGKMALHDEEMAKIGREIKEREAAREAEKKKTQEDRLSFSQTAEEFRLQWEARKAAKATDATDEDAPF